MLLLRRDSGMVEDRSFAELATLLEAGDLVVLNDSRVLPARLFATRSGFRTQAGSPRPEGIVEVLLTERMFTTSEGRRVEGDRNQLWRALVKPAKKVGQGEELLFAARPGEAPLLRAFVTQVGEFGERTLRFEFCADALRIGFLQILERIGHLPLPPYIHRGREEPNTAEDREQYQTVYSRPLVGGGGQTQTSFGNEEQGRESGGAGTQIPFGNDSQGGESGGAGTQIPFGNDSQRGVGEPEQVSGSAAAPTAGLHFTPEILARLRERGVETATVTLHVGLGTFRPVRVEHTEDIRLHAEPYTLPAETAEALNRAYREGRRIVAVGTTTTRTLEHLARQFEAANGPLSSKNPLRLEPHSGATDLFLSPGPAGDDRFRLVGGLLTNFHLPESTLLMLVSAFAGRERVLRAYAHAVRERYRFFSYGDCMLVL